MRIGIDCRLWSETGVGRYIRNVIGQLQQIDQNNSYILFVLKKEYPSIYSQLSNRNFQLKIADIGWHSWEEQIKFPRILYHEPLDLMHFPYFSVPVLYNRPFIVTIHDLINYHFSTGKASTLPLPIYQLKRLGYRGVLHHAVNRAKKILVPLDCVKEDIIQNLQIPHAKIVITYEGIDEKISHPTPHTSDFQLKNRTYFLYVGNAYPHKNLATLIKAFDRFKKNDKQDTQLVLVGKQDYFYQQMEVLVKTHHMSGISFLHDIGDADLAWLYHHAKALVLPSFMEGFGLPALEALANGCLILASDIPAFREVCGTAAFFFDPRGINELVNLLQKIAGGKQSDFTKKITDGKNRSGDFSWEKTARKVLNTYNSSI